MPCYFPHSQVVSLTCEQHLKPVEVEVLFQTFPSTKYSDAYTVTCRSATNQLVRTMACRLWSSFIGVYLFFYLNEWSHSLQVHVGPIDRSACSVHECKMPLRLVENPTGYNISLTASINDTTLDKKSFLFSKCV